MMEPGMKIKVESEKIIKAVRKLDGIEIVLENADDGKEALNLILRKTGLFDREDYGKLKDVTVTPLQKYETSAVDYKMIFLLEFIFDKDVTLDTKVGILKEFQAFFNKI
jgi:copper chaperone CopZ